MALSTTDDYKLFVNQFLYYLENNMGGIDAERICIYSGILPVDLKARLTDYATYKKNRDARSTTTEVNPNSHGENGTIVYKG